MESICSDDRAVIHAQIGRSPRGLLGVAVRCDYGYPQVIRVSPWVDGAPFPTLFWLTCPYLSKAIDRLEADGWIGRLERRLAEDPMLQEEMERAHRRYIGARAAMLTAEDRHAVEAAGTEPSLSARGIGGIADWRRLKCLHLHVAHELADANPIGRRVCEMLPTLQCPADEVRCRRRAAEPGG